MGNSFRQTVAGIFSNPRMNTAAMLEGHLPNTLQRAVASGGSYLIAAQDTAHYNYSGHRQMAGLGAIQGGVGGIMQHNVLLMDDLGHPLGLVGQQYWTRKGGMDDRGPLEALLPIEDPCARFGNLYLLDRYDESFKMGKRYKHDHYTSYDGFDLVSALFLDFCGAQGYRGLEFRPLREGNFFWLKVHEVLEFDPVARGTRFINYNEKCWGYEEVIGATPVCLKNPAPVPDGIFRTDLFFADGYTKNPVLMVGIETREKMLAHGLKGTYFEKILDRYPWQDRQGPV